MPATVWEWEPPTPDDDHDCYVTRPLTPEVVGQQWVCADCGTLWVATRASELPWTKGEMPSWVHPDSVGWRGVRA